MPDYGDKMANRAIKTVDRRLKATYVKANRELHKKLDDFTRKYAVKDAVKRQQLADGKITAAEYADWKAGQVFQRKEWEHKCASVAQVLFRSNEEAAEIIHNHKLDVFSGNYNFMAYIGEKTLNKEGVKAGISFDVYNTQAVARLVQKDPQTLPKWKIDEPKDYKWNLKKVNNIIKQGIIQGESIPQMTDRLCKDLCTMNENKMRIFAQTAITGAQNAGRQKQMEDAADMGINVSKQWIATQDRRTRRAHLLRDGDEVPYNEEFSGGLEYPGDPDGDPDDVYNCRCTMITVYPDYQSGSDSRRAVEEADEEDFEEWLKEKQEEIDPIQQIKDIVANHSGDWSTDELRDLGRMAAEEIDRRKAEEVEALVKAEDAAREEKNRLHDILGKARDEYYDAIDAHTPDILQKKELYEAANKDHTEALQRLFSIMDKRINVTNETVQKFISDIRPVGGVTESSFKNYMSIGRKGKTSEELMKAMNLYPTAWLEKSSQNGISLKPHWTTSRAYYSPSTGKIMISGRKDANVHELGHRFESTVPGILKAEREFYAERTKGESLHWLGRGYRSDERTRKDNFISPYMGKDYGGQAYELVSMGFQYTLTDYDKMCQDEDMRNWTLGILCGI